MALFIHQCISSSCLCTHTPHTQTHGKRLTAESQGHAFPPSSLSQPLPLVIKEGNTFSVGLFVYWFPPLFGELGTKTEFILSWPPALSLNIPHLSFFFSSAQHPLSMDE